MSRSSLSRFSVLVVAALIVGPLTSVGWSVREFQNEFYATYLPVPEKQPAGELASAIDAVAGLALGRRDYD